MAAGCGQGPREVCPALVRRGLGAGALGAVFRGAGLPSVRLCFRFSRVLGGQVPRRSGRLAAAAWRASPRSECRWQQGRFLWGQQETGPSARKPPPSQEEGPLVLASVQGVALWIPVSCLGHRLPRVIGSGNSRSLQGKPFSRGQQCSFTRGPAEENHRRDTPTWTDSPDSRRSG